MEKLTLLPKYQELFDSEKSDREKMESVLNDTINHYNSTNRCHDKDKGCRYSPVTANMEGESEGCAVGRLFNKGSRLILDNMLGETWYGIVGYLEQQKVIHPFMLKQKIFFDNLQSLHDVSRNWNSKGLTEEGKKAVSNIRERI